MDRTPRTDGTRASWCHRTPAVTSGTEEEKHCIDGLLWIFDSPCGSSRHTQQGWKLYVVHAAQIALVEQGTLYSDTFISAFGMMSKS